MKPFFFLGLKAAMEMHVHVYMFVCFYEVQILVAEREMNTCNINL